MSYYLMHRGWMEKRMFQREPFDRRSAWVWLIEHAAFADSQELRRGQVRTTLRTLAKEWKWSLGAIQRFLETGTRNGMFECISDTRYTTITICNYKQYQDGDRIGDTLPDTPSPITRYITDSQPDTQYKESKKEEDKKGSDSPNGESASLSNGNGADPIKALWDRGKSLLRAANVPEKQIGSLIGKWRKEFGDAAVMAAIAAAEDEAASDPVSFMAVCLARSRRMSRQPTFGAPGFG